MAAVKPLHRLATLACLAHWFLLFCAVGASAQEGVESRAQWKGVERVVVVPDIHGAYPAFVRLLQTTGVVDEALQWTGGDTHLVSLGDLLDRGPQSRQVMDLLMRLQRDARATGGEVHVVAGNHELMNLIGDLRYVAKEEFAAFAGDETAPMREQAYQEFVAEQSQTFASELAARQHFDKRFPAGFFAHRRAFSENGRYGQWLLSLPAVVIVNDVAYAHGGLPPMMATISLDEVNATYRQTVRRYVQLWHALIEAGVLPDAQGEDAGALAKTVLQNAELSPCVQERMESCEQLAEEEGPLSALDPDTFASLEAFIELSNAPVLHDEGPLWYRGAVLCRAIFERPVLDAALANLGVERVVVGHTTSPDATVHTLHDQRLTALDTGMLVSYYAGRPAALVIENETALVQYLDPDERKAPDHREYAHAYGLTRDALKEVLASGQIDTVLQANGAAGRVQITHNGKTVQALYYPLERGGLQELAAYALDQMLGFEVVPVTVEREVNGKSAVLQLTYTDAISEAQRSQQGLGFGGWCPVERQLQLMYTFDVLTANAGRSFSNLHYQQRRWALYLTDHGNAFGRRGKLPSAVTSSSIAMTPSMRGALAQLDETRVQEELGQWLDKKAIKALLRRRDAMLKVFE